MNFDVLQRLQSLQTQRPYLFLYALVDGAQYQTEFNQPLAPRPGHIALFDGTPDAPLAHAGPWLIDPQQLDESERAELIHFEQATPGIIWLIALADLHGLADLLRLRMDARLPDGRKALLRFWDPRVLTGLVNILQPAQRETLFGEIEEWHFMHQGQRVWIGRHA
ncbi:hypothetical protein HNQ59_001593 [Chitinivorax tropicus]|uniref:DUF4123 domain-containing protein n=1 Tax=Chitinivorax tropicus TaxID=714531 RepID=A0A840MLD2_9PROT|nr:DUF4123 domain-containing protein [Chitinivorax tropicus]MBB5018305.1 hypothetical protein [Chitinivorax tropicus]